MSSGLRNIKKALQYPDLDLNIYQSQNGYVHSFFDYVCRQENVDAVRALMHSQHNIEYYTLGSSFS